jgi:hypothetical protein
LEIEQFKHARQLRDSEFCAPKLVGNESKLREFCGIQFCVAAMAQGLVRSTPRNIDGILHHNVGPLLFAQNQIAAQNYSARSLTTGAGFAP